MTPSRHLKTLALAALALALAAPLVHADPHGGRGERDDRRDGGAHRADRRDDRRDDRRAAPPRWFDGAHGHAHSYPTPGWSVRVLPPQARFVFWAGVRYSFLDGVWYGPGPAGYAVVRPPFGIVIDALPPFRTVLTIGGLPYYYANGVYYRDRGEGGYEVVPPPVAVTGGAPADERSFVYPRLGQSPERQASDEYECHRWAVDQSDFDPTAAATGQSGGPAIGRRGDYQRARIACLEGRGYTVR